jgi:hypothetical protein
MLNSIARPHRTGPLLLRAALAFTLLTQPAWAKAAIHGTVQDRNGQPMARVNVRVIPGNIEIVTDDEGQFTIDYLRDAEGKRQRLAKRTLYTFEVYKLGFQLAKMDLDYKQGEVSIEPVTLTADTITVRASTTNLDPASAPDTDSAGGGSYEGE